MKLGSTSFSETHQQQIPNGSALIKRGINWHILMSAGVHILWPYMYWFGCLFVFWRVIRLGFRLFFQHSIISALISAPANGRFTFMSISYMLSACFILCQPPFHLFLTPPTGGRTDMSNRSYIKSALWCLSIHSESREQSDSEKPLRSVTFDLLKWKNFRQPDLLSIQVFLQVHKIIFGHLNIHQTQELYGFISKSLRQVMSLGGHF